jgi:uncharacterized membrane protein
MGVNWLLLLMRAIHVVGGVFWVGGVVVLTRFVLPAARASGPAAGPMMQQMARRKLGAYIPVLSILTVLSGLGLYWHDSGGFRSHEWLRSPSAMTFGAGGLLALIVFALGISIISPTGRQMERLGARMQQAGGPPAPELISEMQAVQARMAWSTTTAAVLLTLTALLMSVARYV